MKNLIVLALATVAVCALNIGCTASAGIHASSTTKSASNVQVAYVAPSAAR